MRWDENPATVGTRLGNGLSVNQLLVSNLSKDFKSMFQRNCQSAAINIMLPRFGIVSRST